MPAENAPLADVAVHDAFTFFPVRHTVAFGSHTARPWHKVGGEAVRGASTPVRPFVLPSFRSVYSAAATFAR